MRQLARLRSLPLYPIGSMPPTPARTLPPCSCLCFFITFQAPIRHSPAVVSFSLAPPPLSRSNPPANSSSLFIYFSHARKKMLSRISISHTAIVLLPPPHLYYSHNKYSHFLASIVHSVSSAGVMHLVRSVTSVTYWLVATVFLSFPFRISVFACVVRLSYSPSLHLCLTWALSYS